MNEITAGQLVYTRVGKDDSPRGEAGFQTVFCTPGFITPDEVEDIESRLVLDTSRGRKTKRVFFQTLGGNVVVSRLLAVDTLDGAGRSGNYLAHGLLFSKADFARLGGNPFDVFRSFAYFNDLEQALAAGDTNSGEIPALRVHINTSSGSKLLEFAHSWTTQSLRELLVLGSCLGELGDDRRAIAVCGSQEEIEQVFELLLLVVPEDVRGELSFDSEFSGMRLQNTPTWAIGCGDGVKESNCVTVDGHKRDFISASVDAPLSPYSSWVAAAVGAGNLAAVIDNEGNRRSAWVLSQIVSGGVHSRPEIAIAAEFAAEFSRINRKQVAEAVTCRLCSQFGTYLGQRAAKWVMRSTSAVLLFPRLIEGFLPEDLAAALWSSYCELSAIPEAEEIEALSLFLNEHDNVMLRVWHSSFEDNTEEFRRSLPRLDEARYREFIRWVLRAGVLDAAVVILPGRGRLFVEAALEVGFCDDHTFSDVLRVFVDTDQGEYLLELLPLLDRETRRGLSAVYRAARGQREKIPESFLAAVSKRKRQTASALSRAVGMLFS